MKFVPEAYDNAGKHTVALLRIVREAHVGIRAVLAPAICRVPSRLSSSKGSPELSWHRC